MRGLFLFFLLLPLSLVAKPNQWRRWEKRWQQLAAYAIPRTVLITVYVPLGKKWKKGYGSGAIISKDGYILTCAHVVELGQKIEVTLWNGKVYLAKRLGMNRRQDFALLKIHSPSPLPFFSLGNSRRVRVGDWVMALGHPGGPYPDKRPAVSLGTVTGLERKLYLSRVGKFYNQAIRTDIPIYMGNSGGPLLNMEGKLIGINGAIIFINRNSYAIPIHQIQKDLSLLKQGKVFLGKAPSFSDLRRAQREVSPKDWLAVYRKLLLEFYRITLGRAIRWAKRMWKKIWKGR